MRLDTNKNPAMDVVRRFQERSEETGRRSMVKDVRKYASEFRLCLTHPRLLITCVKTNMKVTVKRLGVWMKAVSEERPGRDEKRGLARTSDD